jgi:hypothetical protein
MNQIMRENGDPSQEPRKNRRGELGNGKEKFQNNPTNLPKVP